MILPNTRIISRQNEKSKISGIDCLESCNDRAYFQNYPYAIDYNYNERGFRDHAWPEAFSDLQKSIWCFGDSFTSGVGVPFDHMWAQILQKKSGRRTINVSLDGASNEWIMRHANYVIQQIQPEIIVIHWSYSHRRELPLKLILDQTWKVYYNTIKDPQWPNCDTYDNFDKLPVSIQENIKLYQGFDRWYERFDLESPRRSFERKTTVEQDLENTQSCISGLLPGNKIIHSFIPKWHPEQHVLDFKNQSWIPEFEIQDYGRDKHHYDIKTATGFVDKILNYF